MARYSSCPWVRFLVLVLQVGGSFQYSWPLSQVPSRPEFSLKLLLWALFMNFWNIVSLYLNFSHDYVSFRAATNVGIMLFKWSWVILYSGLTMSFFVWLFKGENLVDIFSGLDEFVENEDELDWPKRSRLRYFYLLITYLWVTFSLFNKFFETKERVADVMVYCSFELLLYIRISVAVLLFSAVSERMANVVHLVTQQATAPAFVYVADQDTDVPQQSDHLVLETLTHLEKKLLQFDKLQVRAVSYFFEVITVIMVTLSTVIITGLFCCVTPCNNVFVTLGVVLFLAVHIITICFTGHRFTDKMNESIEILKVVSSVTNNEEIKTAVYRLGSYLSALSQLDMKGWYTLNNGTLVTTASFVTTYLVIMLQVGQTTRGQSEAEPGAAYPGE